MSHDLLDSVFVPVGRVLWAVATTMMVVLWVYWFWKGSD